jgi:hypothetical protein
MTKCSISPGLLQFIELPSQYTRTNIHVIAANEGQSQSVAVNGEGTRGHNRQML